MGSVVDFSISQILQVQSFDLRLAEIALSSELKTMDFAIVSQPKKKTFVLPSPTFTSI